jgi:hypothetical protein
MVPRNTGTASLCAIVILVFRAGAAEGIRAGQDLQAEIAPGNSRSYETTESAGHFVRFTLDAQSAGLIPHRKGAQNAVPSFITQYGPIREVRFQKNPDGTPDGGVHALFTVVGRSDSAPGCTNAVLPPTDFESEYRKGNLSFRIPLQTFGLGLIEAIQDSPHRSPRPFRRAPYVANSYSVPTRIIPGWDASSATRPRW